MLNLPPSSKRRVGKIYKIWGGEKKVCKEKVKFYDSFFMLGNERQG
jgi:hypothetical protein